MSGQAPNWLSLATAYAGNAMRVSMIIKNRSELVNTVLRKKALDIAEAGITRILPSNMMQAAVQCIGV